MMEVLLGVEAEVEAEAVVEAGVEVEAEAEVLDEIGGTSFSVLRLSLSWPLILCCNVSRTLQQISRTVCF